MSQFKIQISISIKVGQRKNDIQILLGHTIESSHKDAAETPSMQINVIEYDSLGPPLEAWEAVRTDTWQHDSKLPA